MRTVGISITAGIVQYVEHLMKMMTVRTEVSFILWREDANYSRSKFADVWER